METVSTAPGKVILFGEHAVVYGEPAIAAPVTQVRASAVVTDALQGEGRRVRLCAPDLGHDVWLDVAGSADAIAAAVREVQRASGIAELPGLIITVRSTIPIASGLGSGAAIAAATIRALARHLGRDDLASDEQVSSLAYEVEKIHHGTPSGIDNTVVAYEKPVYFLRRQPRNIVEIFRPASPLRLLVADTGIHSSTRVVVGRVRECWEANRTYYEGLFAACGKIAAGARKAVESGDLASLGRLMNENHLVLQEMGVSSAELDRLVEVAQIAGAMGAKLSGAGWGGNMIALVDVDSEPDVRAALQAAGARTVLQSVIR